MWLKKTFLLSINLSSWAICHQRAVSTKELRLVSQSVFLQMNLHWNSMSPSQINFFFLPTRFWCLYLKSTNTFSLRHWRMILSKKSRFDARYWMLRASALGRPRGMVWGGRREEGSGWGTHVYLWQIHFDI